MPITLTVHITHPDVVRGDARTSLYNSVAQTLEVLGPEWNHHITTMTNGNLFIEFHHSRVSSRDGEEGQVDDKIAKQAVQMAHALTFGEAVPIAIASNAG